MGRSSSVLSALVVISGLLVTLLLAPDPAPSRPRAAAAAARAEVAAAPAPDDTPVTQYPPKPEVVVVGQPHAEPSARMHADPPSRATPRPGDRAGIARELQRELKRVGCYWGELNGAWTPATRKAAKSFTERINAALPDEPDLVLLTLVQAQQGEVCGAGCPAGQTLAADGRCLPTALLGARRVVPPARPGVEAQPAAAITLQSSARSGAAAPSPAMEGGPPQAVAAPAVAGMPPPAPGAAPPVMRPGHAKQSAARPTVFGPALFRYFGYNGF